MPRLWPIPLFAGLLAAAALGAVGVDPPRTVVVDEPPDDPIPIRRVRVPADQLPGALKAFDLGVTVRLPRAEFESRVRAAGRVAAELRNGPRLAEAAYTASLTGEDLTGTAEWVVVNPGGKPAGLPLDPLRLALRAAVWADGREAVVGLAAAGSPAGRPAVVGVLGPGFPPGPAAWVERPGRQVLRATWSVAGTAEPGHRRYELRVPPCPAAALALDLPADHTPAVLTPGVLLTGPGPGPAANRRTWRVRFGGRSVLAFTVRGPADARGAGTAQASLAARYEFTPGQLACSFEYDLQPGRDPVTEWAFTTDPGLRVTDVVVNNRDRWDAADGKLRVTLREPGTGGKVLVSAVGPIPDGGKLPVVRPVAAVVESERLEVRVHPDLRLDEWRPGDFRLTESAVAADQTRVLTAAGTLLPPNTDEPFRRPPHVRVSGSGPEFVTAEAVEWRTDGGQSQVAARVAVKVRRGPLFQLALKVPDGYRVTRVTAAPTDLVSHHEYDAGRQVEVLDFFRPLTAGQAAEVRLELRGPAPPVVGRAGHRRGPLPAVDPLGAAERDGWLAVCPGPDWAAVEYPPAADAAGEWLDPEPPADAAAVYPYHGQSPHGAVTLAPVRPRFAAETETRLVEAGNRVLRTDQLTLRVRAGAVAAVHVFEPGPPRAGREWRLTEGANGLAAATPVQAGELPAVLPLFAAPRNVLGAVAAVRPGLDAGPGTLWVLRFARPATGEVVLESTVPVAHFSDAERAGTVAHRLVGTVVPLLTVGGAERQHATVELGPALTGRLAASPARDRYDTRTPTRVTLTARAATPAPPPPPAAWRFADLYLLTAATHDRLDVVFGGRIPEAGGSVLPVTFPDGAEVRAVAVGRYRVDPGRCRPEVRDGRPVVLVPLPANEPAPRFEVRYELPAGGGAVSRVTSPVPGLPGRPDARRWWGTANGLLPAWPARAWEPAGELPPLLADPPAARWSAVPAESAAFLDPRAADTAGVALAVVVALLGWAGLVRPNRIVGVALYVVLLAGGPAVLLGPPGWHHVAAPPLAAALAGAAVIAAARGGAPRPAADPAAAPAAPSGSRLRAAAPVGVLLACLLPLVPTHAQPPAPVAVLLVREAPGGPDLVVAPRDLLARLDDAAKPPVPAAVVTAAHYDGRADAATARFTARFTVDVLRDGKTPVTLPLADARLERVTVNGGRAHPVMVRPDVYAVALPGRGRHTVEAEFAVPVAATGPEREVRFGIPETPVAGLAFAPPPAAHQVQVVGRSGARHGGPGPRLAADLGGGRAVHLRWREGQPAAPAVTVREACVWDVSEAGAELTACFVVQVDQGLLGSLRFELPAELDVARAAVRPLDAPAGSAVLRDWHVGDPRDGTRQVRLDLHAPTAGRLLATLECNPRRATTRRPVLRFPRLVVPGGRAETDAVYGLRAKGVVADLPVPPGFLPAAADTLAREFGAVADLKLDPAVPVRAFRPTRGAVPELKPLLRVPGEGPAVTQTTTWRVSPPRADAEGTVAWAAAEPLSLLEFAAGGAKVAEVRGADVLGWSQAGGRVQVWLRRPVKKGAVEWAATLTLGPAGKPLPDPLVFEVPVTRVADAKAVGETLRVRPADGWAVRVDRDRGWKPVPPAGGREWAFHTDAPAAGLRLHLFAPRPGPPARGFGLLEVGGPATTYRAVVNVPLRPNRPHALAVSAAGLPQGAAAELEAPPEAVVRPAAGTDGGRAWGVELPPSPATHFRMAVVVRFPTPTGPVRLPVVAAGVGGVALDPAGVVRWFAVSGPADRRPAVAEARAASPADLDRLRTEWPGELDRVRRTTAAVWAALPGRDPPRLVFPTPVAPPPVSKTAPAPPPEPPAAGPPGPTRLRESAVAAGWCLGVAALAALFARAPRLTWPEQLGLAGGLFGAAVAGGWWLALPVAAVARVVWLVRLLAR